MLNIPSLGFVPMNTKILFGFTLVAVLVMAVASPAVADAVTGIKKTEIKVIYDTETLPGPFQKHVTLFTNIPGHEEIEIFMF